MSSFAAYFSHSWNHLDLPLNLMLWQHISKSCHLIIDQPEPSSEEERPYFISRLESILRHANVMLCCMPSLPPEKHTARRKDAVGDWRYNACSPYILFELRLAERLDLPRFVLYDRGSRFQRPAHSPPHVRYVERDFGELKAKLEAGNQDHQLLSELDQWLAWVAANRTAIAWTVPARTACLLNPDSALSAIHPVLRDAVDEGGFDPPELLTSLFHTDAELYQVLRSLGLLIVDIQQPQLMPLYHAAHSLMVPTIRIDSLADGNPVEGDQRLPLLLKGHPAGYQHDLLIHGPEGSDERLYHRVLDRAKATSRAAKPVVGADAGMAVLYERTYPKSHFVFISHDEKLNDRELVGRIVRELKAKGVVCWEYAVENRSGEVWIKNMLEALSKTTLMVALLSPGYEQSQGCKDEWEYSINHGIPLLPFLSQGRTRPNVDLRGDKISHEPLYDSLPVTQRASLVADRVIHAIRNPQPA